jgi:TonB family protein
VYTEAILAKHLSGFVVLAFVVEINGAVTEVKVKKSPAPELSESAIECIKKWRFQPWIKDGAPARVEMELALLFDPQRG